MGRNYICPHCEVELVNLKPGTLYKCEDCGGLLRTPSKGNRRESNEFAIIKIPFEGTYNAIDRLVGKLLG